MFYSGALNLYKIGGNCAADYIFILMSQEHNSPSWNSFKSPIMLSGVAMQ